MPSAHRLQPAELQRLKHAVDAFPPRAVANYLLSVCIEHGTDSFFYFDEAEFLSEIDGFYSDPTSNLRYDAGFICLALATFALGSQWTTLTSLNGSASPLHAAGDEVGRAFYEQARLLVPDLDESTSLRSVQAPFVLGVYLLPGRATGSLHMHLGLALRKAIALDLHVNAEGTHLSAREREIRSRIWWAVFSLERQAFRISSLEVLI